MLKTKAAAVPAALPAVLSAAHAEAAAKADTGFMEEVFLLFPIGMAIGLAGMFSFAIAMLASALRKEKDPKKKRSNRTGFFAFLGVFLFCAFMVATIRLIAYGRIL